MTKTSFRLITVLVVVFAVCFQAHAQVRPSAESKPFAWKLKSATTTAYLLGSIHVAKADFYPLNPKIESAFSSSNSLAVEVDVTNQPVSLGQQMMMKAAYPPNDGLEAHISKEVFGQVDERLKKYGLGAAQFKQFKPWFVAQTLLLTELQRLGFSPENGIDLYFLQRAKGTKGKKILELEKAEDQLNLFDSLSDREQELFLISTLKDLDNMGKNLNQLIGAWFEGDPMKVEKFLTQSVTETPELAPIYQKLIDDRNKTMALKIEGYLKTGDTCFIVVGAAHLVGENGILNLLKEAGYSVEQL